MRNRFIKDSLFICTFRPQKKELKKLKMKQLKLVLLIFVIIGFTSCSNDEEPEEIDFYMCGPPMMNDAVQKMLYNLGVPDENVLFDDFGS